MDEDLPVTAKHLIQRETLEEREKERVSTQA